ncbi:MAG: choice-of-anchor Q domain-containing protein [Rhodanobacteraceae bacterium]
MHRLAIALSIVVVFIAALPLARAESFEVDTTVDTQDADPGDGNCADTIDGRCSLRAAIQESNALDGADRIELPSGVFALTIAGSDEDLSATGDLDITGDLTLEGDSVETTVIDGNQLDRVLDIPDGTSVAVVKIEQLTVRNGALANTGLDAAGVGLHVADAVQVTLQDVVIRDHSATSAFGGIAIDSEGCIEGSHVRLLNNRDTEGAGSRSAAAGGVYLHGENSCLVLSDSEISGNAADWAGAIQSDFGTITIRRSLISNNEARFAGALLLNFAADTLLENVTISGNLGSDGAALNDGGSNFTLVNCTVTNNGPYEGITALVGGIDDVHGGFGLTFLSNTILSGNGPGFLADDCNAATSVGGGNIVGDSARCRFDADPTDQLDADPELGPLVDNGGFTWTHLVGLAAIDRAQAGACPAVDQRGAPRPVDGDGDQVAACDVGALEIQRESIFANGFD